MRLGRAFLWAAPFVFLCWLWFDGLKTWFVADDFAWLGVLPNVHSIRDLLIALFAPAAQGTIRPLSERAFFLLFESLFGLDSLPFRICAFLTMAANLALLIWIARRISGSLLAGSCAAILWTANAALATVMSWNSAWNEALSPFFLLAATAFFIRYVETGRRSLWRWQAAVFVLGFGALEVNVVYPAIAAAYVLFVAPREKRRHLLLGLIPLFCISAAWSLAHVTLAPLPRDGVYALHFDSRIFHTIATYWQWSLRPWSDSTRAAKVILWILTFALAAFLLRRLTKHTNHVLFFAAWFLITLAPVVPLPLHISDYYLTIPLLGLAMLAGAAVARACHSQWTWRVAAIALLAAYLGEMIPFDRTAARWWLDRSLAVRGLVLGVQAAERTHPGKTIVLDRISSELYDISLGVSAVTSVGLHEAYLTPASQDTIHPASDFGKLSHLLVDSGTLHRGLASGDALIYSDLGDHLRNDTNLWKATGQNAPDPLPRRVEAGNPLYRYALGREWLDVEPQGVRWMQQTATIHLRGPDSADRKLVLDGWWPETLPKNGLLHLSVSADGMPLGAAEINDLRSVDLTLILPASLVGHNHFRYLFAVNPSIVGRSRVDIGISVDRVSTDPGGRRLGLLLGAVGFE